MDLVEKLQRQAGGLSQDDLTRLIGAVADMVDAARSVLPEAKLRILDDILAGCASLVHDPQFDDLVPLGLKLMHEADRFRRLLLDRSDRACASFAAAGLSPMSEAELLRACLAAPAILLRAIAARSDLNSECTDAIADRADAEALMVLVDNLFAPLSEKVQERFLAAAADNETLRNALLRRPVLTMDVAMRLFTMAGLRLAAEQGALPCAELGTPEDAEMRRLLDLGQRVRLNKANGLSALEIGDLYDAKRLNLNETMISYTASGHVLPASELISQYIGVPSKTIVSLFGDGEDFVLAAICRWMGLNPAVFVAMGIATDRRRRRPTRSARALLQVFAAYEPEKMDAYMRDLGARKSRRA